MSMVSKILIIALAFMLASCNLRSAKTTPPPRPTAVKPEPPASPPSNEPLSIPQTQVQLPRPQPIDPEALATPPIILPEPPARVSRRKGPPPALPIKPEQPEPVEAPPAAIEAQRPRVEPVLPGDQRRQLIEDVSSRLKQVEQKMARIDLRRLSEVEKNTVSRIHSFLVLSRQALDRGETQQASGLADRALLLVQELDRAR
jgi:hypothetical protein